MVITKANGLNLTSKNDILDRNICRSIFVAIVYSDLFFVFFYQKKNSKTNISTKLIKTNKNYLIVSCLPFIVLL